MQFGMNWAPLGGAVVILISSFVPVQAQEAADSMDKKEAPAIESKRFDGRFYRFAEVKAADGKALRLAIAKTASESGKKRSGNELLLTALVPLNAVLPIDFGFAANGKNVVTIPYRNCNHAGCWAQQKLDQKMLSDLQKGSVGEARLRLMNGQNINLKFSLKGVAKALAEWQLTVSSPAMRSHGARCLGRAVNS